MTKRIGFCCKYKHHDQSQKRSILKEIEEPLTDKTTTVAWCTRQSKSVAEKRLLDLVQHNLKAAYRLVQKVGHYVPERRMVRLSSGIIPLATHADWKYLWEDKKNQDVLQKGFLRIGELARSLDVRLSFHPGQFCVLASDNPQTVENSIEEFEYHANMAKWMGYGNEFADFKINVHISGKKGPQGIKDILPRLSPEARNTITIENDEFGWGLGDSLELVEHCALVLDLHHHWVRTGEYIQPEDDRCKRVIESWRGVRPVIHYSYSRDEHLPPGFKHEILPEMDKLLGEGYKKQKLRAHSELYPNKKANEWALSHWEWADIQAECKMKNLGSKQLYDQAVSIGLVT